MRTFSDKKTPAPRFCLSVIYWTGPNLSHNRTPFYGYTRNSQKTPDPHGGLLVYCTNIANLHGFSREVCPPRWTFRRFVRIKALALRGGLLLYWQGVQSSDASHCGFSFHAEDPSPTGGSSAIIEGPPLTGRAGNLQVLPQKGTGRGVFSFPPRPVRTQPKRTTHTSLTLPEKPATAGFFVPRPVLIASLYITYRL